MYFKIIFDTIVFILINLMYSIMPQYILYLFILIVHKNQKIK